MTRPESQAGFLKFWLGNHRGNSRGNPRGNYKGKQRSRWPFGIRGRLLLIIAVGVLAAQGITGLLFRLHHSWEDTQVVTEAFGQRVVAIATLLEATPPDRQDLFIETLNDALLEVQAVDSSVDQPLGGNPHCKEIRMLEGLRSQFTQARGTGFTIQVCSAEDHHRKFHPDHAHDPSALRPSRHQLVVTLDNPAGGWWVFTTPLELHSRRHGKPFWFWVILTGIGVWLLSGWATRRVTAPILRFAAAADRLGMDVNAPPLPERGSRELRQAAQAFNQMQTRLQRLIRDRTFMLAAISHDLRTVLTRLRLRTEFIEDAVQQQKAEADLAQMEAMLVSTLAFAKEDSTPEDRTQLDLASLLQSICDDLSDAGGMAEYRGPDRFAIQGQPIALRRAFTNLIENAVLYGKEARVTIIATDPDVRVEIGDRGPGIPEDMHEKVFEPFFRLEPSRNRETGGTGLGLAVARTVVRRHGGDISLAQRDGGGLMVEVTVPISFHGVGRTA